MGLFNTFLTLQQTPTPTGGLPTTTFTQRAVAGLAAGGLGALIGTPADLALVRMQADGMLKPGLRKDYKNVADALMRITREEGVARLWNGAGPTVVRAMALNLGMLAT